MSTAHKQHAHKKHLWVGHIARLLTTAMTLLAVVGTGGVALKAAGTVSNPQLGLIDASGPSDGTVQPDPTSAVVPSAANTGLPFTMPSKATLQASPHKVFAHYMPSLPISLDNQPPAVDYYARNYLAPAGEGGQHILYGGFLRDRPLGRAPLSGDWRLQDMETDVRQAIAAGIDGFDVDILQLPGTGNGQLWANVVTLFQAAAAVDSNFKIIATPDMNGDEKYATTTRWAAALATLAQYSSAYRLGDGRLVVAPFLAEAQSPGWYQNLMDILWVSYHINLAFVPIFVDDQRYSASFAPISYGMSNWGARNPQSNNPDVTYSTSPIGRARLIRNLGKIWMQPVSFQDERPSSGVFEEADNTQNLRNTWKIAMASGADWVNLTTWNDYSEGSAFAPSQKHGWSLLDINAYYLAWFKTGSAPPITRDAVYLTHRTQAVAAPVFGPQTLLMRLGAGSAPRNTVEALTFTTAPATVIVTVGSTSTSCAVGAGVGTCTVPLGPGAVSAWVVRSAVVVAADDDPYRVTGNPYAQDLQYVASGSLSSNGTGNDSKALAAPVQRVTLNPISDTFANAGAPHTSFGSSWSMSSRGNIGAVAYLRFQVPAPPGGQKLIGATLQVTTTTEGVAGTTMPYAVSVASNAWDESTLNWANRPALSTQLGSLPSAPLLNTPYLVPLNVAGLPSTATQLTLAISGTGTDGLSIWSTNHGVPEYRPTLALYYG